MQKLQRHQAYIHSWVQQHAEAGDASARERSTVSRLSRECLRVFKAILKHGAPSLDEASKRAIVHSYSSFVLWIDGYGVAEGDIDTRLEKSRALRRSIFELLTSISTTLMNSLLSDVSNIICMTNLYLGLLPQLNLPHAIDTAALQLITSEAFSGLCEDYDDEGSDGSGSGDDGSDAASNADTDSHDDLDEIAEDLKTDTQCLMDLDALIQSPVLDPQPTISAAKGVTDAPEPWAPFSHRISQRFPGTRADLVARLAQANLQRFQRIQDRQSRGASPEREVDATAEHAASEGGTKFHDSGLGTSVKTPSAYAETVMSYHKGEDSTTRIPPLSEEAKQGRPFDCLACGCQITVSTNSAWK